MMEFHISREARDRYQVSDALFNFVGNVIFADLGSCRELALRMTQIRAASGLDPINPGALFAMGLIDEVSHFLVAQYRRNRDPQVTQAALDWFAARVGEDNVDKLLRTFVQEFPNVAVYRGETTIDEWLQGSSDGLAHREAVLEELMLLWLANQNPAFRGFRELYDDKKLAESTAYKQVTAELGSYFATRPDTGMGRGNLLDLLRAPMEASPDSLSGQLAWIRENWSQYLGEKPPQSSPRRRRSQGGRTRSSGCASIPARVTVTTIPSATRTTPMSPDFRRHPGDVEYERFSPDQDWMPNVVMIAKSTYVWLAQLSRQYGRAIERPRPDPRRSSWKLLAHRAASTRCGSSASGSAAAPPRPSSACAASRTPSPSAYSLFEYNIAGDPRRRLRLQQSPRARRPLRHSPRQRHGPQPHGHRFPLGHRAS
jgi:hypothetical protein